MARAIAAAMAENEDVVWAEEMTVLSRVSNGILQ
jgi:hypothetical protein